MEPEIHSLYCHTLRLASAVATTHPEVPRRRRGADVPEAADRGGAAAREASGRRKKLWSSSAEPPYNHSFFELPP
jgi:hypothetical protein